MEKNFLQFDLSEWWIPVILLLATALTWFLYSVKKNAWSRNQNLILAFLRWTAIVLLLTLLLEPIIKQSISRTEKPIVTVAVDNSQSVSLRSIDSTVLKNKVQELVQSLEAEEVEVELFSLNSQDSFLVNQPTTDLSSLQQQIINAMEGRNWVASVLLSDGIFNRGSSPIYKDYTVPQHTIGLGDTIPPRDINISRVRYNRLSYKGNDTPINIEISQQGYRGQEITVELIEDGKIIQQEQLRLSNSTQEISFTINSENEGLRRISARTKVQSGEFVSENNSASIFMEVIDGKQKVLIVASSPHPDIKAIKSALTVTENYEITTYMPSIDENEPDDIFDVVIYHGAFSRFTEYEPKENPGIWYILNGESVLNLMNTEVPFFNIRRRGSQTDKVTSSLNSTFTKFEIEDDKRVLDEVPPLEIPFGDYDASGPVETLLFQKVGSIATSKPLFTFFDDGSRKLALLAGQNIWKWKLQETAIHGDTEVFQQIVSKTVQYLSVKNDKKQFRFRVRENSFSDLDPIRFDSEVYNDIYERVYGNNISIDIINENGVKQSFEFADSEYNSTFKLPALEGGIYSYTARTMLGDKRLSDKGQFLVEKVNREYLNLTADHNILKNLSLKTSGKYFHHSQFDQAIDELKNKEYKAIIRSAETLFPLIRSQWMLVIILVLFSIEWLLRKYWGGY